MHQQSTLFSTRKHLKLKDETDTRPTLDKGQKSRMPKCKLKYHIVVKARCPNFD